MIERSQVRLPAGALLGGNSGHVVHTHVPLTPSSIGTGQGSVMLCGWEGNRIGPASHWPCVTDSVVYPGYGLNGLYVREMSTPPTPQQGYGPPLPFYIHPLWTDLSVDNFSREQS